MKTCHIKHIKLKLQMVIIKLSINLHAVVTFFKCDIKVSYVLQFEINMAAIL